MTEKIKRFWCRLKQIIGGNYCEKCERCIYWYRNPYDGFDTCDFHLNYKRHANIIKDEFNQIIDCEDFEEKVQ